MVAGALFYYGYSRKRETAHQARTTWMERIERREYKVLVALSNRDTVSSLMEAALAIASPRQGEVVITNVVEVPEGEPIVADRRLPPGVLKLLQDGVAYAKERGIEARPLIKIGRRISHALIQTAREEECNFLVIGQPYRQSFFERIVSSVVERVLEDAPCQVAVVYGTIDREAVTSITLPVTSGPNSLLAAKLATGFGEWFGAGIRALTVIDRDLTEEEAIRLAIDAQGTLDEAAVGDGAKLEVLRRRWLGRGLLRAIKGNELVLIGAPTTGPVVPLIGDTIPALLARRNRNPVIVVRAVPEHRVHRFERVFFARK